MGKDSKRLKHTKTGKKNRWIYLFCALVITFLCLVSVGHITNEREGESKGENTFTGGGDVKSSDIPWNLILVNKWNPLPNQFAIEFTVLSNGQRVDSRIYPELQNMFDDARAEGVYPTVREGFRTYDEQVRVFEDKVNAFMQEGYRRKKAEDLAKQWVAIPGTSEHELGLAVDINADKERSSNEEVYSWLAENAWKYGFILRYPQGKESITGIDYEPWHYRYVGEETANEINEEGITLEEYMEKW